MRLVMAKIRSRDQDLVALKGEYTLAGKKVCKIKQKARHRLYRR